MIDFTRALQDRGALPNSTWLRADNTEMLVVLPDDETAVRNLCQEFECEFDSASPLEVNWIRVIRMPVEGKSHSRVDMLFVPYLCGQIDKGILTRIG